MKLLKAGAASKPMTAHLPTLFKSQVRSVVGAALLEDLGARGDLTTDSIIPGDARLEAFIRTRQDGRIAGLDFVNAVMAQLSDRVGVELLREDGSDVKPGDAVARLSGPARPILSGERVVLNYLCHLSGIATATRNTIRLLEGLSVRVTCTRKTTPGLRAFEKYAVRVGGGYNHRFGLYDAILIKDNHIAAVGGDIGAAIDKARAVAGHILKIEVEVDTLDQLAQALKHQPDIVLLDNMRPEQLRRAVSMIGGRAIAEASGGISPDTIREVAETGVDVISLGWLTHSAPILDLSLDIS